MTIYTFKTVTDKLRNVEEEPIKKRVEEGINSYKTKHYIKENNHYTEFKKNGFVTGRPFYYYNSM